MSSRRILQVVASKSIQLNAKRVFAAPVVRSAFSVNRGFNSTVSTHFTWKREFNSQSEGKDIFKVIDYNDIQNIIKKEGKVIYMTEIYVVRREE